MAFRDFLRVHLPFSCLFVNEESQHFVKTDVNHNLVEARLPCLRIVTSDFALRHIFEKVVDFFGLLIFAASIRTLDNEQELRKFNLS